ncbi:MAG: GumC family protein [Flavobacteriales bacterium]|jgi:capsular exopolysaccharide synthesis family protein
MLSQDDIGPSGKYRDRLSNVSNEFDAGLFLYIVRKSLVWVAACIAVAVVMAYVSLRYTPLVYKSSVIIQLAESDQVNKILNVESPVEESQVEAKLEQLRSKLLISRTIQQLPIRVSYFARGQVLTNEHYTFSPYKIELIEVSDPGIHDIPITIRFDSPDQFSVSYSGFSQSGMRTGERFSTPDFTILVTVDNPTELMKNEEGYDLFFRINSLASLTNRFYQDLDVRVLNNTAKTIQISYRDNNPYLARDFVRAHANEFIAYDLEKRRKSDDNVLDFLNSQIDTVFSQLRESEVRLNSYKQQNRITNLDDVGATYLERLNNFEAQEVQLQLDEGLLDQVERIARRNATDTEVFNIIPLIAGSPYEGSLSRLLDKLYNLLSDRQEALLSVTAESERVKSLNYQIDVQKTIILQSVSALRDQIRKRRSDVQQKIGDVEATYYRIPQKELEFARLQRLFSINEKYYTLLLEKAIEYRISKEGFVSNNQILEEARVPSEPIAPRRRMVWASYLLGALILGFLIVAIRYLLHNQITSLHEVVRISDASLSTLGIVPRYREDIPVSMLIVDRNPRSLIAEAFRAIRTNLQFISNAPGPKVVAITSTISGEGKTFVALNLAGIIAFSGKRVVVCDLDMRRPKIHRGLDSQNSVGMSTLLIGKSSLDEVIGKSPLEHLDFITSGPIPPNPSELIMSEQMVAILNELRKRYDVIILDTPPVGLVADAIPLLQQSDYPIYVFRSDYSRRPFIQVADKLVNENHIPVSVILNGVDLERARYSRRYSYGYGYGYGYASASGYYDESSVMNKRGWLKRLIPFRK